MDSGLLDSVKMEARLLPDKLVKCWDLIWGFLRHQKVTLREVQMTEMVSCHPQLDFAFWPAKEGRILKPPRPENTAR